ncbi:hypothetical protein B0H21DRAFT_707215 [Amylocystis lapponica]|nr:hypothetical protein B0H21DRAFT_707215 [Amylocystis lapponica]
MYAEFLDSFVRDCFSPSQAKSLQGVVSSRHLKCDPCGALTEQHTNILASVSLELGSPAQDLVRQIQRNQVHQFSALCLPGPREIWGEDTPNIIRENVYASGVILRLPATELRVAFLSAQQ